MNRRKLMKLAPVALAAGAVPALAMSGEATESPIAAMHREITRLQALACHKAVSDADQDAACERMMELADAIQAIPARNTDDMLRKIMGTTVNGDHEIGDGPNSQAIWAEARSLVGGAA